MFLYTFTIHPINNAISKSCISVCHSVVFMYKTFEIKTNTKHESPPDTLTVNNSLDGESGRGMTLDEMIHRDSEIVSLRNAHCIYLLPLQCSFKCLSSFVLYACMLLFIISNPFFMHYCHLMELGYGRKDF